MECASLGSLQTPLIAFCITLMARALFSFLETSITSLRLFKLKELAASSEHQYRPLFTTLEKTPHQVLISIIIANSLADVTTAALATYIMEIFFARLNFSGGVGFSLGIGITTLMILIFGEIIPKNVARGSGERLFPSTLWITNIIFHALSPIANLLMKFSNFFVSKIMGNTTSPGNSEWISECEIQFLIGHITQKGLMEREKTEMLQNIFDLGRTLVRDIVIPASDIISISSTSNIKETLDVFVQKNVTRLPVYEGSQDNIIGMIHMKDVFALISQGKEKTLKNMMRPVLFVPDSIKVNQVLREFKQQRVHLAIALDEHGNLAGLITLEDVLEEIVGNISDEHDPEAEQVTKLADGGWLVQANMPLDELSDLLMISFDTKDSRTIGGFLTECLQHLPKKGERILYKNFYFQVQKASPRRVLQVLILEEKDIISSASDDNAAKSR